MTIQTHTVPSAPPRQAKSTRDDHPDAPGFNHRTDGPPSRDEAVDQDQRHLLRTAPVVIGLDVGSTTVKAVVVDPDSKDVLWHDYQRHHTQQPECVMSFMTRIGCAFPKVKQDDIRIFVTGSGASPLAEPLGARFVQEVNAVTMAVELLHPTVRSVIELGGQDAKIIMLRENPETGEMQVVPSMNDKCASGTGATIDKCFIKTGIDADQVGNIRFNPEKLHHVAAKCGVFAETDVVNLIKTGVPGEEVLCSLADAIVMQNLAVLTRGNTLQPGVLLLGGPNTWLPFLVECWRMRIPETWAERGVDVPDLPVEELIYVPPNAELYAALGSVFYGMHEPAEVGVYKGIEDLKVYATSGRKARLAGAAGPALVKDDSAAQQFASDYAVPDFDAPNFPPGTTLTATIGVDGGSTSSKAVLVAENGDVLLKTYQLSKGNPIQDMKEMLAKLKHQILVRDWNVHVKGFGVTGYAGPVLEQALQADAHVVETVAHMMSAVHYFGDVDVICDIGGQDIKVLFMKNGDIENFRLSNQCSAGNGMLLQAMADQFGVPVTEYATTAFSADMSPEFSYGCAVFLDADRVNFQKEGYSKQEMLAGLALVLPKNVWQYVVQIPRMAELGKVFVLQGGTQRNLAAVKAQVDYINERVPGAEVHVHPHPGEAGAIGAAMEAWRKHKRTGKTEWVGLEAAIGLSYISRTDESTRCHFCPNLCSRTFIDTETPSGVSARYISGFSCEQGTVEDKDSLKKLTKHRAELRKAYPNLVEWEGRELFRSRYKVEPVAERGTVIDAVDVHMEHSAFGIKTELPTQVVRKEIQRPIARSSEAAWAKRKSFRVGIPRVLNLYSTAPFFRAYFEAVGIDRRNIVFSDHSGEEMWVEGGKYGSIDPCHPSKVTQAHIHNLLFSKHAEKPLDCVFLPQITHVKTALTGVMDHASCPIVQGIGDVMRAAFTKERDLFGDRDLAFITPAISFTEPHLLADQLFKTWGDVLGITRDESDHAAEQAHAALTLFRQETQARGRQILDDVEAEDKLAILMLGRPYHLDPGLNHEILAEFQALGYPILSMGSIPTDPEYLHRFFREDLERADDPLPDIFDINDVWPENFSANSAAKVWAAKFAARHPNIAVLDLSSFKCGHDAPIYHIVDNIIGAGKTPYSALHDLDANKPGGSIAIRVRTYGYTLERHKERLEDMAEKKRELARRIEDKRAELRARYEAEQSARERTRAEANERRPKPIWVAPETPKTKRPAKGSFVSLGRLKDKATAAKQRASAFLRS
ncbi:MAG: CoA activase [Myxococcales bacterium]|nr:CoA activase [Myxococcales bacterium]